MTKNDKNLNNSILSIVSVTQISPIATGTAGGAKITITGSGFQEGAVAYFGSQISKESILESETSLRVVVPMTEESGSVPVTVVNPDGGQFTLEGAFTYINSENGDNAQVFGVSPLVIIEEANTEITLRGRNLIIAYKDGLVALRCPSRVNIEISSVVQNEADENGIESLVFKATVTATPPLLPLERIAIQILASRRPEARDDLMVESSTQMFTVIPRDIPVPLAFTPSLSSDNPTMVVVLGENLEGCTLEFDSGTQTHVQMCDSHSLMGITTVTENMASGQSTMVSVLDKNGASVGQYSLSIAPSSELKKSDPIPPNDNSLFSGEGGIIETMPPPPANFTLDIVPIPNQKVLGPTEKDNLIFDLRGESQTNAVANAFNYTIQVYSYTIHFRIINRVYLFPLFDGGGSEFNSPILAKVGELFPVRGAGILVAFRLDIYLTVTVYIIIGINFDIPWFGYFNEFPQQFPNAIGIVIVGVRIEIDIYILASFMAALVLPDGRLQIIFLVVLIADFHFTISSDLHRLSFLPHFTHEVHHAGIFSGNNLLPCGGRFQLADDNGQTMFQDAHGGHLSYYFARSTGECCMPWRFNLEVLQISSTNEEIVVQPPFDVNLCLNALESGEQIKVVIESVPPPTGNPETLVMNIADTAVLRALSVPVDQNGNPTGPGQDITELGYGVEFYLDQPLEVLSQGQLPDGVAIAIQEGSNIIRAAVTSVRILDDEQFLSFWQGSILGFDIIRFLAEGQPPRLRTGGLPVTVNPNNNAITITPVLAYEESQMGQTVLVEAPKFDNQFSSSTDTWELVRNEPFENQREFVLAVKVNVPAGLTLPDNTKLTFKIEKAMSLHLFGTMENSSEVGYPLPNFSNERRSRKPDDFFIGSLVVPSSGNPLSITVTLPDRVISSSELFKVGNQTSIKPNIVESNLAGTNKRLVPPGAGVSGKNVLLKIPLKCSANNGIIVSFPKPILNIVPSNDETFEEYLRVFQQVQLILENAGVYFKNFASDFTATLDLIVKPRTNPNAIRIALQSQGEALWIKACELVQGKPDVIPAIPPYLDDRPLYWSRLQGIGALRSFAKRKGLTIGSGASQIKLERFEWASRGLDSATGGIVFPVTVNSNNRKAIITGFDPFGLSDGSFGNNDFVETSNPSGLIALKFNENKVAPVDQGIVFVRTAIFPVRFSDFNSNIIEEAITPSFDLLSMIMSISQNGGQPYYDVERWAARNRSLDGIDNNNVEGGNAITIPSGSEFLESTLPFEQVITIAEDLEGPKDDSMREIFPFVIDQSYKTSNSTRDVGVRRYGIPTPAESDINPGDFRFSPQRNDVAGHIRVNDAPITTPTITSESGSGGNYLSNEIFYRVALKRISLKPTTNLLPGLATGHFHVPPTGFNPRGTKVGDSLIIGVKKAVERFLKYTFRLYSEKNVGFLFAIIGQHSDRTVLVTNNTRLPIIIATSEISSPFSILAPSQLPGTTVNSGVSIPITIRFAPIVSGQQSGKLVLKASSGEILLIVNLSGEGLQNHPAPTISNFSPRTVFFGDTVTVAGQNFVQVTDVKLSNDSVNYTVISDSEISVEASAFSGRIQVFTLYGTVTSSINLVVRFPQGGGNV